MSSRRDLLVGIGGLFSLAGCAETEEATSTPTATQTSTATQTQTTSAPTESATATTPETETETATSTPDPRVQALDSIERKLVIELSDFTINAEIDTRSLKARVPNAGNNDRLYKVRDELGDIDTDELTDEQQRRYTRLQSAFWFVWWIELLHNDAVDIVNAAAEAWDEERGTAGTGIPIEPLERALSTAISRIEDMREDSSAEGLAELNGYGTEEYNAVMSRYDRVISQGELLIEKIRLHQEANAIWNREEYEKAEEKYRSNADSYAEADWLENFQPIIDEMICYAETMVQRSQEFYRAQRLEEEGDTEDAKVTRELAPDPEEECSFGGENGTATPESRIFILYR